MLIKNGSSYKKDDFLISLPHDADTDISKFSDSNNSHFSTGIPRPLPYDGTRKVLVVRAIGIDTSQQPDVDAETISKRVFGGDDDNLNLKDGYAACSGDQLKIEKATGNDKIVDGVLEVNINMNTTDQTGPALENAIATAAKAMLGTNKELESIYDFILMCLPPGTGKKCINTIMKLLFTLNIDLNIFLLFQHRGENCICLHRVEKICL